MSARSFIPDSTVAAQDAARSRGDLLRTWMSEHTYEARPVTQAILSRLTGFGPSIIAGLMARTGHVRDIGLMQERSVSRLVSGMRKIDPAMTGERAAEMFDVPVRLRARWVSAESRLVSFPPGIPAPPITGETRFPVAPAAAAPRTFDRFLVPLHAPLMGTLSAPAGWVLTIDPAVSTGEILWIAGGCHWAMPERFGGAARWFRVGGIVSLNCPGPDGQALR